MEQGSIHITYDKLMKIVLEKVKAIPNDVFINNVQKMARCTTEKSKDIYQIK